MSLTVGKQQNKIQMNSTLTTLVWGRVEAVVLVTVFTIDPGTSRAASGALVPITEDPMRACATAGLLILPNDCTPVLCWIVGEVRTCS